MLMKIYSEYTVSYKNIRISLIVNSERSTNFKILFDDNIGESIGNLVDTNFDACIVKKLKIFENCETMCFVVCNFSLKVTLCEKL